MYFGSKLKRVSLSKTVSKLQATRRRILGFAEDRTTSTASSLHTNKNNKTSTTDVRVGDVVSIVPDEVDKTKWQNSSDEWLAYVQGIKISKNGTQQLLILWLYRPADTNMCLATYPFENEVFLSDNCNCSEREIFKTDVARIHSVDWNPKLLSTTKDLIIRQTYITQDSAFVSLSESHKVCSCRQAKSKSKDWRAGDTVYITKTTDGQDFLEPVLIHEINHEANRMRVRLLLRLARDCPRLASEAKRIKVAPNELVLTGKVKIASISHIKRGCSVCFVPQEDVLNQRIPPRYDKGGAGDYWFISMGLDTTNGSQRLFFLQKLPKGFHEDREVPLPCQKLRGLSLFSGGGGLDRGLEEGGAVEFQTSVDYDSAAIHTQRANCEDTKAMRLFCGSVDDYLQSLLTGRKNSLVAQVGEVDLVAAGSPCPGTFLIFLNCSVD
jgi:DNA (cytosine-5)-methyltransferase 1